MVLLILVAFFCLQSTAAQVPPITAPPAIVTGLEKAPQYVFTPEEVSLANFYAQNDRLRAMADYMQKGALAELTLAKAQYERTRSAEIRQRIQFLNTLLIELREDMKYLLEVQKNINATNRYITKAIQAIFLIRRDGKLWSDLTATRSRIDAIHTLLSLESSDVLIEEKMVASWLKLRKIPCFEPVIDESGIIYGFSNLDSGAAKGLNADNFVKFKISGLKDRPSDNSPILDFTQGGSFFELLGFLETNQYNLKTNSLAHRIFNAATSALEASAKENIKRRIDEYYLPLRQRVMTHWSDFYLKVKGQPEAPAVELPPLSPH